MKKGVPLFIDLGAEGTKQREEGFNFLFVFFVPTLMTYAAFVLLQVP